MSTIGELGAFLARESESAKGMVTDDVPPSRPGAPGDGQPETALNGVTPG
jgi:hypothetical protein